MRRLPIILPLAILLTCSLLFIAAVPGRLWYSQLVQRPHIEQYAQVLGVAPEQHLVTGTKAVWDSSVVVEYGFYLLPRNAHWSTYDATLTAAGLQNTGGSHGTSLSTALPWVAGGNRLSLVRKPRTHSPSGNHVLYQFSHAYCKHGRIGIRITDTRSLREQVIIDGKDLDDYYALMIDVGDCQYGSDCL